MSKPTKEQLQHAVDKLDKYRPVLARYRIDGELVESWITQDLRLVGERKAKGIK